MNIANQYFGGHRTPPCSAGTLCINRETGGKPIGGATGAPRSPRTPPTGTIASPGATDTAQREIPSHLPGWEQVQEAYRASALSLRAIAAAHWFAWAIIRFRPMRAGWTRTAHEAAHCAVPPVQASFHRRCWGTVQDSDRGVIASPAMARVIHIKRALGLPKGQCTKIL